MRTPGQTLILGCALLLCGMPAYAYIDPGTGSALIQGLIAAIAAVGITLRLYWHRVAEFIRRIKNRKPDRKSKHTPP